MNLFSSKTRHQLPDEIKKHLTGGLLISLLVHAFILSLQFGLPGIGLPDLDVPWDKRRAEAPEMSVQIANAMPVATPVDSAVPVTSPVGHPDYPTPRADADISTDHIKVTSPQQSSASAATIVSAIGSAKLHRKESDAKTGIQLLSPIATHSAATEKKKPMKVVQAKKNVVRHTVGMQRPQRFTAVDVPDLISQDVLKNDAFSVAVRDPEDTKKELVKAEYEQSNLASASQSDADGYHESVPAVINRFEPDAQLRERREEKKLQIAKEVLQEKIAVPASVQQSVKQMEEDSRKQVAEAMRIEANAARERQQLQQEAEQQRRLLQEASNARIVAGAEQQRLDNIKLVDENIKQQMQAELTQREQQRKERQSAMFAARQLAEEREEKLKRQQEEALRQQQEFETKIALAKKEELLTRQKAEQLSQQMQQERLEQQRADNVRQQTEQISTQQREREKVLVSVKTVGADNHISSHDSQLMNVRSGSVSSVSSSDKVGTAVNNGSATSAGTTTTGNTDKSSSFVLPKNLLGSDLANRAREQAGGLDLLRGSPPVSRVENEERARRRSIFGSYEKDVPLRMYVDSWKQKIERNGNLNYSQLAKDRARGDPIVNVAIRSDGSVEEITIIRSSGRADLDDAVRRIIRLNARYAAFPPNIAAQYDVIEIRRIWNFDDTLKILEEMR